jgi:hypothetical protein
VRATTLDLVGRRSAGSTRRIPPGRRSACCRLVPAGGGRGRSRRLEELRDGVEEGGDGGATGWSCDGGARVSWDGESPGTPKDASRRPLCCKLHHLLRLLLEPLQCASDLQFVDEQSKTLVSF